MYSSVTLLFPGQGSQYVGMGDNLLGHSAHELLSTTDDVLGYPLSKLMKEGPEEELKLTQNTQPAIVSYSVALYEKLAEILKSKNIKVDRVLGHSVGEYSALVAAGALNLADATKAVHLRGKFMQEAVAPGKGKMIAVMRVPQELIKKACQEVSTTDSQVMPANFNEPGQTVISGAADACDRAVKWLEENSEKRFRAIELKVSAPFHSSLMGPARDKLAKALDDFKFNENSIPYIANIDATEYPSGTQTDQIKKNLIDQVCGSVQWYQSVEKLSPDTLCIEVGPGNVLAGLVKKTNRDIKVISLDQDNAFLELEDILGQQ